MQTWNQEQPNLATLFLLASALAAQTNYDLLVQGGRVIDPKNGIDARMDVAIANGKIARVAAAIPAAEARKVVNVSGLLVTPGLIDTHVHVYQGPEKRLLERDSRVQPDAHTFRSGVTTVVDAGTTGWRTFAWLARACLLLLTFLRPVGIATAQKYLIQM